MSLKLPSNQIIKSKYTSGKEYMFVNTYREYQGYFYELNGKTFAGKEFSSNAPELVKIVTKNNTLLTNPLTVIYGNISKYNLTDSNIKSVPFSPTDEDFAKGFMMRYFVKKMTENNNIKEINVDTFNVVKNKPLYQTLEVKYNFNISEKELNELDKKMSGLKLYLSDNTLPTSRNENNI